MTVWELLRALLSIDAASLDYDVVHNGLIVSDIAVRDDNGSIELVTE